MKRNIFFFLVVFFGFVSSQAQELPKNFPKPGQQPANPSAAPREIGDTSPFFFEGQTPWIGGSVGASVYEITKRGVNGGAIFKDELGITLGHLDLFGRDSSSGNGWLSYFAAGYSQVNGQTFGDGRYVDSYIGSIGEYSALYSISMAWTVDKLSKHDGHRIQALWFLGPSVEYNRFLIHAHLSEASDRSAACKHAVDNRKTVELRKECEEVKQEIYSTTVSLISGLVVGLQNNFFGLITFQPSLQAQNDTYRLARSKLLLSVCYKF